MTTGQRIAAKRKELGLSQEALGERLGVSRQSIYKWESDTSLPDIDKLVAMSRMFSVPVGWLLGVEEDRPPTRACPSSSSAWWRRFYPAISRSSRASRPRPQSRSPGGSAGPFVWWPWVCCWGSTAG